MIFIMNIQLLVSYRILLYLTQSLMFEFIYCTYVKSLVRNFDRSNRLKKGS